MLDNKEIENIVNAIAEQAIKELKVKAAEQPLVRGVAALTINLLQNINDIAWKEKN